MRPLLVLGTGAMALEIADLAEDAGHSVVAFVENLDRARSEQPLDGRPVLWVDDIGTKADHAAICGLGTTRRARFTDAVDALGIPFATVVHPSAHVSKRATLGPGTIVGAVTAVAANAVLGEHVLVNRGATVGHDTSVGRHTSLQPGAIVAGRVRIGRRCWIGAGAIVLDDVGVGDDVMVAAAAVVNGDLPDSVLAAGSPARVLKRDYVPR